MRMSLLVLALVAGCASTPAQEAIPTSQPPTQGAVATSTTSAVPSQASGSHVFANRLTLPPSSDWTEDFSDSRTMRFQFAQGKKCKPGECPQLVFYTEGFSSWSSWFDKEGNYVAFGPCEAAGVTAYGKPVRLPSGDITVGGKRGEYYESAACRSGDTARRTWLFRYEDQEKQARGVVILGFPTSKSMSDRGEFSDELARKFLTGLTWT